MAWPPMLREPKQKRILFFLFLSLQLFFISLIFLTRGVPQVLGYHVGGTGETWGTLVMTRSFLFFSYDRLHSHWPHQASTRSCVQIKRTKWGKKICVVLPVAGPAYRLEPPQSVNEQTMKVWNNNNAMIITSNSTHTCHERKREKVFMFPLFTRGCPTDEWTNRLHTWNRYQLTRHSLFFFRLILEHLQLCPRVQGEWPARL